MKDNFDNDVKLGDCVVFPSRNEVRFGIIIDVHNYVETKWDWNTGQQIKDSEKGTIHVLYYGKNYWRDDTFTLIRFSPRNGFTKIPREALPAAFNELLVKNGY